MAMAVQKLYPDAKVTIGPWIENGFYYDFDMEPLTDKDLKRIKKEMVSILAYSYHDYLFLVYVLFFHLS
jgi:threonyl-tRNA synthetase